MKIQLRELLGNLREPGEPCCSFSIPIASSPASRVPRRAGAGDNAGTLPDAPCAPLHAASAPNSQHLHRLIQGPPLASRNLLCLQAWRASSKCLGFTTLVFRAVSMRGEQGDDSVTHPPVAPTRKRLELKAALCRTLPESGWPPPAGSPCFPPLPFQWGLHP